MTRSSMICLCSLVSLAVSVARAQDVRPLTANGDTRYFDFWPGVWQRATDGRVDSAGTRFIVRRDVNEASYLESWWQRIDSATVLQSTAIRAWDKTNNKWMFVWISSNGLYQEWEGRKIDADWYIYRHFDVAGDRYLSRQGWVPQGPDRVMRVSEKSYDDGKTWQLRFREFYIRTGPPPAR